jgi:diguanylate cyclase (GGDEF)-like protein
VFLIDIDHFKRIFWGHAVGDAVLVEVARRLRSVLREPDLIVRWGGEEFLVVVRALSGDAVEALAGRMLDVIGAAPVGTRAHFSTSASIGSRPSRSNRRGRGIVERAINLVDTPPPGARPLRAYGVRNLHARRPLARRHRPIARACIARWRWR